MILRAAAVAVVASLTMAAFAIEPEPSTALPLDLAYSSRDVPRNTRPVLSPDGRYLAYEIHTPPVKTPDVEGKIEQRFLPSGVPSDYIGRRLWVSDTRTGESKPACGEGVTCWRGSWSPSATQLAFYSDEGGEVGLWLYDVASGKAHRAGNVRIKAKLWPGDEAAWSPDGKTVFVPARPPDQAPATTPQKIEAPPATAAEAPAGGQEKAAVTVYRTAAASEVAGAPPAMPMATFNEFFIKENNSTLTAVDLSTGEARVVVPFDAEERPNNLRLSPDGKWVSYLTVYRLNDAASTDTFMNLVIVPAAGGKPVRVIRDLKMNEGDYFGSTYRWTPDSRRIVYQKNQDLWIADVPSSREPQRLGASLGKLNETLLLTENGKAVLVGIEPEGEKTYYSVPARALAIVPLDGTAPRVIEVTGQPLRADDSTLLQTSPDTFHLLRDVPDSAQREIVEVNVATAATKRLWSGQGRFNVTGASPDRRFIVSRFEGLQATPDFYLFDTNYKMVRRLSSAEPRLDAVKFGPMESFETRIPGHDGKLVSVRTYIFLPPGAKRGQPVPTIVYFYSGAPFSTYAHDFGGGAPNSIPVQVFASRGYGVLFCDVPMGPTGKAGNPIQEITDAILPQVYRAAELGYSDIDRMAIMGQSYGGYSTAAIITNTNVFRAAIALDGLYDLGGLYSHMGPSGITFGVIWSEKGQGRMGTHPWADQRRYIANSPYYLADKIHTPLLLIHGEKDDVCPVEEALKMFNALKRLEREAELATYAGEGHVPGEWGMANITDATNRMLDFLARHMSGKKGT